MTLSGCALNVRIMCELVLTSKSIGGRCTPLLLSDKLRREYTSPIDVVVEHLLAISLSEQNSHQALPCL